MAIDISSPEKPVTSPGWFNLRFHIFSLVDGEVWLTGFVFWLCALFPTMIISGLLFGAQFRLFPILFIVLVTMVLTQIVGMLYGKARYGFEVRSSFFWSVNWRALFLNVIAGVGLILLYIGQTLLSLRRRRHV